MEKPDERLDDAIEATLQRLETSDEARASLKLLQARALDRNLPGATSSKPKSRF